MADKQKEIKVEDLSPRAQSAVKIKKLMGRGKFRMFQNVLRELASFDAITDELYKKAVNRAILYGVLMVIGIVGFAILVGNKSEVRRMVGGGTAGDIAPIAAIILVGALALLFLFLMGYYIARLISLGSVDLSNDFRLCLSPFLDEIADDLKDNAKMKISVDMKGLTDEKLKSKKQIPPGRFKKVTEYIYYDPWLKMSFDLVDGNQVMIEVENHFVKHDRRWTTRSASGKTKFKHKDKWKKLVIVSAILMPNSEDLDWDPEKVNAVATEEKLKVAEKKGVKVCRLCKKYKFKAVNEEPAQTPPPNEMVGILMQLYSMLKPANPA